jgi:hypothetical protein
MEVISGALVEGYGLTESSPITHCNPLDRSLKTVKIGSIGLPWPDTDAKIMDMETGEKELGVDEIGELAVKGPQVMKGYWNMPEETSSMGLFQKYLVNKNIFRTGKCSATPTGQISFPTASPRSMPSPLSSQPPSRARPRQKYLVNKNIFKNRAPASGTSSSTSSSESSSSAQSPSSSR